MTYAGDREIYDADGHIMELPDWLPSFADENIKKKLMPFWTESAGATLKDALDTAQKNIALVASGPATNAITANARIVRALARSKVFTRFL